MSLQPKVVDFYQLWTRIRHTISKLITLEHVGRDEWDDGFGDVYALCYALPYHLHDELYFSTEEYLVQHVTKIYKSAASSNEQLLVFYYKRWKTYSEGINYLTYLYWHLNLEFFGRDGYGEPDWPNYKVNIVEDLIMPSKKLGLVMWKRYMIEPLKINLLHRLVERIRLDPHGDFPNQTVLHGVIESFVQVGDYEIDNLKFYREFFETTFLEATGEYYKQEASRLMLENDCSQYMEKVIHKLEEDFRRRKYLHPSSYSKMIQECEKHMVADKLEFLMGGSKKMVKEENKKDLQHMYRLLKSFPSETKTLIQELEQHITETGMEAITALGGDSIPQNFVEKIIALYNKFRSFIELVFCGGHDFVAAFEKACISIINHDWNPKLKCQAPELLAKYCDSLLTKTAKPCSEDEVEKKLNYARIIFNYINDKDISQMFYARFLAKRLIYKKSISMDAEESMIKKMKESAGNTNKLQCMISDISISNDLNSSFKEFKKDEKIEIGISFSISVLRIVSSPFVQTLSTFSLPQELEKSVETFESFYRTKFKNRKLTWMYHLCNAELKLCYLEKPYVVSMSTYQMAILLLFERIDVLTYGEIAENTKLNDKQLPKQIKSLLESKLILATDSEESFKAESSFSLNKNYTNKRKNFKLAPASQKETKKKEVEKAHESVSIERKIFLKAAIVRLMKARRVLRHDIIIQELINQAKNRFVPDIPMINKCIAESIERGYIEKTPNSRDEYSYVA